MPDPVEEALDEIALSVEPGREAEALLAVGMVRKSHASSRVAAPHPVLDV